MCQTRRPPHQRCALSAQLSVVSVWLHCQTSIFTCYARCACHSHGRLTHEPRGVKALHDD